MRITIACPVGHLDDAAQFARATGYAPDDERTFTDAPDCTDAEGNLYRVASGVVAPVYVETASGPLPEPAWGADMAAAARAQALIAIWQPPEDLETDADSFATPDRIAVVIGDDPQAALAILGLSRSENA